MENPKKTAVKKPPAILKAVALVGGISVITRALSFVFKVYLSRAYGAESVGLYQIGLSIFFLLAAVPASGLPLIVSRKTAALNGDKGKEFSLVTSALILGLGISAAIVLAFFAFPTLLNALFTDKRAIPVFKIILPALFSTTVYCVIRGWFWGKKNFTVFSFTELFEEIFRILFSVLLAGGMIAEASGASGIAAAFLISDVAAAIMLLVLYLLKGGSFSKPLDIKNTAKSAASVTAMRVAGSIVGSISAVVIPARLVAAGMSPETATAEFGRVSGMAVPLLLAPLALIGSIAVVLIPDLASDSAAKNLKAIGEKVNSSITASLLISGIFLAVYLPFGREIGEILYKDSSAGIYLQYTAILMLPIGINQLTSTVLNSIGLEFKSFLNFIIGAAVMTVLTIVLPKYIGIYAVAAGSGACYLVTCALNLGVLKKKTGLSYQFMRPLLLISAFAAPSGFISHWLRNILAVYLPKTAASVICMLAAAVLYLSFVWCFDLVDIKSVLIMKNSGTKNTAKAVKKPDSAKKKAAFRPISKNAS